MENARLLMFKTIALFVYPFVIILAVTAVLGVEGMLKALHTCAQLSVYTLPVLDFIIII